MQAAIHPKKVPLKATCTCGNVIETFSTIEKGTLSMDVCSKCHPFYTGKQKIVDTAGRVDQFMKRYPRSSKEKTS